MSVVLGIGIVIAIALVVCLGVLFFSMKNGSLAFKMDIGGYTPRATGGNDVSTETSFKGRLIGLAVACTAALAALAARLYAMQIVSGNDYAKQAESNRTRTITTVAPRGRILDRNGKELVTNRPSLAVVAYEEAAYDEVELTLLAHVLGMPQHAVKRKIRDRTEGRQSARTVAVDVSQRSVAYIQAHTDFFPHVAVMERTQRYYPHGSLAAHVLGYTGTVSDAQLKSSQLAHDEDSIKYQSGDTTGQAGIEYQYESILQGVRGEQTVYVDAVGTITERSTPIKARSGNDIMLTLDLEIQRAAEESLRNAIKHSVEEGATNCRAGSLIVLDATNGEVLAMANEPTFSPGIFIGGISSDDWDGLSSDSAGNPLMNRAVTGQYPPASTIKPLTALAALAHNHVDPSTTYVCKGFWTGFGEAYTQKCWLHTGHGPVTLRTAIIHSCDIMFYEIGKAFFLSGDLRGLQNTFEAWGLSKKTDIDLPSENQGRVPDAKWKWDYFHNRPDDQRKWQGGDMTNLAIGQGDLLVTPLQIACVYAALALKGVNFKPHVLKSVCNQSGDGSIIDHKIEPMISQKVDDGHMNLVRESLAEVIPSSGILARQFREIREAVAAKTGTGEHGPEDDTGWFCSYAPVDNPKYVVMCVLEKSGFGVTSAAYGVRDVYKRIYGVDSKKASADE